MKRLYNCKAWYDENGLQSYNTRIITFENKKGNTKITYYNYRSNTTLSHIRKYINLLEEQGNYYLAFRIKELYDCASQYKNEKWLVSDYDGRIKII